jgi:hypothetical protein
LPKSDASPDAIHLIGGAAFDLGYAHRESAAISLHESANQIELRREVMVDACLANADCFGDDMSNRPSRSSGRMPADMCRQRCVTQRPKPLGAGLSQPADAHRRQVNPLTACR